MCSERQPGRGCLHSALGCVVSQSGGERGGGRRDSHYEHCLHVSLRLLKQWHTWTGSVCTLQCYLLLNPMYNQLIRMLGCSRCRQQSKPSMQGLFHLFMPFTLARTVNGGSSFFLGKVTACLAIIGCAVMLCLVCLFASFIASIIKNMYMFGVGVYPDSLLVVVADESH